ncbi:DUF4118 domain-containing protein [Marinilactibacillus psychrotolerans]|uniref:histidine kinase n=1 Tax=Marinilactibacillus psychrotolerans TaxID=191770 RepID=A0AAV3W947_9LACT|nr:DUF4118 domain-containing protein [Marinilactibacillus psychrotolerans]GEL66752.1 hypothetical protein MPS01_09070 [Marinilactibacillus psychrotolerans]GEQ35801.1 hypothetical protein M132T_13090 [Marinilactibacillus psychrotolerans]
MINKKAQRYIMIHILLMGCILGAASGIGNLFIELGFPETNVVIIYLLAVLLISRFTSGYVYGILASLIATILFNYLFTSPYYTLTVDNPSYLLTFIIMTTAAIITSTLTSRIQLNTLKAQEKENETKTLYNLTSRLTDTLEIKEVASIAIQSISQVLNTNVGCLYFNENGNPSDFFLQQKSPTQQTTEYITDENNIKEKVQGTRRGFYIDANYYYWIIYGQENVLGLIRISTEVAEQITDAQKRTLLSMIENTALAMDRIYLSKQRARSNEETTQERQKGDLLRGISHDLRTPLSGIIATAEMLLSMTDDKDVRYLMIKDIQEDTVWLHSLVENVLSLTRLQNGKLSLDKKSEALEEIIDESIRFVTKRFHGYTISVEMPQEMVLVPVDSKLILQVFINLLENAIKHSVKEREIRIIVEKDLKQNKIQVTIADKGEGIIEAELPNIFEPFYTSRAKHVDSKNRVGLGLTICETAILAHGGTITAQNRKDVSGAEFIFTLPLKG